MSEKIIMTRDDIRRTMVRIAHEIIERNKTAKHLILMGVHTRGVPLAQRLAANIERFEGLKIPVGALGIRLHRNNLTLLNLQSVIHSTDIPVDIDGKSIMLVDAVLYTGRSIRAAMDALADLGRPKSIQLAVLVDRGHREMPIHTDYAGKDIPNSKHEEIQVQLEETDNIDRVAIIDTINEQPIKSKTLRGQDI